MRAFEDALEYQPKDVELIAKVARALTTTHDYQRAIDFYNRVGSGVGRGWPLRTTAALGGGEALGFQDG